MSALSDRGLGQSDAGRALEVWRQTLLEPLTGVTVPDPSWLITFHGGAVDLLAQPPEDYRWPGNFGCAVWPVSVEEQDLKIGAGESPLAILTAFYYREPLETRGPTAASIEDLAWYFRAASLSQHGLVWKSTWAADPPDASIIKGGPGLAVRRDRIFPVQFGRFAQDGGCGFEAFLVTSWVQKIQIEC